MPAPIPPGSQPKPTLRLHLDDVGHPASQVAAASLDSGLYLARAIEHVIAHIYTPFGLSDIPKVRSVTVVLRSMDGVAYTTGIPLDDLHKEIHLSLDYVQGVLSRNAPGIRHELSGVITHEMVHCFQNNSHGTAPGGLIEGMADFVRLKAGLAPPHWNRSPENRGKKWDEGYQKTAWFLEWLEDQRGSGTVSRMNETMGKGKYDEDKFWRELFGETVHKLWSQYEATWKAKDDPSESAPSQEQDAASQQEVVILEELDDQETVREPKRPQKFVG